MLAMLIFESLVDLLFFETKSSRPVSHSACREK